MAFTLDNFVRSILAVDAAIGDTSLVVALAAPPLRDPPAASAGAPGILILQDQPTAPTKIEIVTYTGVSIVGTQVTLTGVTRGLEGTTAQAWSAGTQTFSGTTAAVLAQFALSAALATVATSGNYNDLSNRPELGTAAATDATDYATAEQGEAADSALQPGDMGSAAFQPSSAFATAAQGSKADAALPASGGTLAGLLNVTPQAGSTAEVRLNSSARSVGVVVDTAGNTGFFDRGTGAWLVEISGSDNSVTFGGPLLNAKFLSNAPAGTVFQTYGAPQIYSLEPLAVGAGGVLTFAYSPGKALGYIRARISDAAGNHAGALELGVKSNTGDNALNPAVRINPDTSVTCLSSLTATSVTDTSDERLKTNVRRDPNRWRGIRRKVELVLYDRINGPRDEPGVIAQEVQKFAPEFVGETVDGTLTVHYGKLALACALDPEPLA